MKTKVFSLLSMLTLVGTLLTTSCSKDRDDEPRVYQEENPLKDYLQKTGFDQKTASIINDPYFEFGYQFIPKVKGKINAVTIKIPNNANNVKVTIWKVSDKSIFRSFSIPNVIKDVELTHKIDPLMVNADEEYVISFNGNNYYYRTKDDVSSTVYPIEVGNIKITNYRWMATNVQEFPIKTASHYYGGDLSIVFQQVD